MPSVLFPHVRAVLFDLDGTLVDTVEDLAASVNYALTSLGKKPRTVDEVRLFIGDGVPQLLKDSLGPGGENDVPAALELFSPHYLAHCTDKSVLYPGVKDAMWFLGAEWRLGVVTNKPLAPSKKILAALGILDFFSTVIAGDTLPVKKPDPAPVLEAAKRLEVEPAKTLLMGDSPGDITAAHAAGALAVGAAFGYRPVKELKKADALAKTFREILPMIGGRA